MPTDAARHARLSEMTTAGKAKLERLLVLRTQSGQRAVVASTYELPYSTEFAAIPRPAVAEAEGKAPAAQPDPQEKPAANRGTVPSSFDLHKVGDTLEIEPTMAVDGVSVEIQVTSQAVRLAGERAVEGSTAKQPIFETAKIVSAAKLRDGQPYFLGTLTPNASPDVQPQKEPRVWLDFITVSIVRLDAAKGKDAKKVAALIEKAKSMILSHVEFRDATLGEGVDLLRRKSRELDPEKKGLNILLKPSVGPTPKMTLNLNDMSLYEVLRSVAKLAEMEFVVEEEALVVQPGGKEK
jgi:hypothetical protein